MSIQAIPKFCRGKPDPSGCVHVETVHSSPIVDVILWRCLHEDYGERCHTHHSLTVNLIGAAQVLDGARRVIGDPATAIFHRPDNGYRIRHPYGCNDAGISIAYRVDVAQEVFGEVPAGSGAPPVNVAIRPMRLVLCQMVLALRRRRGLDVDPVAMDEIALEMLAAAGGSRAAGPTAALACTRDDHDNIANAVREYLHAYFRGAIRIDDIAREVGASPFHIARVFRRHTGVPIRRYLQRLRLGAAMHALAASEASISRIALDTGFSSHAHLTTVFAQRTGIPPSHVRRLLGAAHASTLSRSPLFTPLFGPRREGKWEDERVVQPLCSRSR